MKTLCEQEDRRFELAGWKFQFSNKLYSKVKNVKFNWAKIDWNLVEKYFDSGAKPEIAVENYLKSIIELKIDNMQIGEHGIKGLGLHD